MKKIVALLLAVATCIALLVGCGTDEPINGNTRTITDGAGRQLEVPEKVESIVCVGVGALRYTCYVGAQDLVIGVEDYEVKPGMSRLYNYVNFDKFKDLPVIGTNGEPYTEEIMHFQIRPCRIPAKILRYNYLLYSVTIATYMYSYFLQTVVMQLFLIGLRSHKRH